MLKLDSIKINEEKIIVKIDESDEIKRHLSNLGFVPGAPIYIVSALFGDLIVNVKDTRIALNKELVKKIYVK